MCAARSESAHRFLWASLLLGVVLSLAACYAIAVQWAVVGSAAGGWVYPYVQPFTPHLLGIFLLCAAAASALLLVPVAASGRREWLVLLAWILAATVLHGAIRSLSPFPLERIFTSDAANSFYSVTQQYEPADVLNRFNRVRANAPLHAQSNMPGKLMLIYALEAISARPDVLPWLLVGLSNLGALLLYAFVRDLLQDRRTALFAAVLYLFVPARIFFFPLMNTVTPVFVFGCACLLLQWLRTGRTVYAFLMGVTLYGLVFFEPLPLVIGVLFAGLSLRAIGRGDIGWDRFALQVIVMLGAFLGTSEVVRELTGFHLLRAFHQIGAHAVEFNVAAGRSYWPWVRANPLEFLFGMGVCQAVLFFAALLYGLSDGEAWRDRLSRPIAVLCLSLLAMLLITNFIGVNRGEVIRLWIFMACFFQIPAAWICSRLGNGAAIALVLACTILHGVLGTGMIGFVIP
jgi:hypothetical protein